MKKIILLLSLSVGLCLSNLSFAQANDFKVYKQCSDETEWSCDVIRKVNGQKEIYFEVAVPPESTSEQITAMADDLSWFKFTYPRKEDQSFEVVVA